MMLITFVANNNYLHRWMGGWAILLRSLRQRPLMRTASVRLPPLMQNVFGRSDCKIRSHASSAWRCLTHSE